MKRLLTFRRRIMLLLLLLLAPVAFLAWGRLELTKVAPSKPESTIPTTRVKRSDVVVTVTARGELQGGNSEMLIAPMTGGREMVITLLRGPGELVNQGDVVVQFDTTEQEFQLREAEADLAEAEQKVIQAKAETQAKEEQTRHALMEAQAELKLAELEVRRNELLSAIAAKQNILALESARDRFRQLEQDVKHHQANSQASIAIQEAARNQAKVKADVARRNIDSMTLKAKSSGYVSVQQNTNNNIIMWGMQLPVFQLGDVVRAGMAVAQLPDMKNWEVTARLSELDRGHLAEGQKAEISVVALPGKTLAGRVKNIGGTAGPPWDRRFECKVAIENPAPELRAGMSATAVITTGLVPKALWVPSQALFESDGRTFVYLQSGAGFVPADVKMVRRSESQVALTGLQEGQLVAMANPDQQSDKKSGGGGALQALTKK